MNRRNALGLSLAVATALVAPRARGDAPYAILRDDGTIQHQALVTGADAQSLASEFTDLYNASGQPLPQFISIWSTFPLGNRGDVYGTYFIPVSNDVQGIGLQTVWGGNGTIADDKPPLRGMMFHNNVLSIPQRAALTHAPAAGFARYLFLLELEHNWGPAIQLPGATPNEAIGMPVHWSFWLDAGGSVAGGNIWTDNGDGTFTAMARDPATMGYPMLDLYAMGLADLSEVPPFGVLESPMPPATPTDPYSRAAVTSQSLTWFDPASPLRVPATRRVFTRDDVMTANGMRMPAHAASPASFTLGIVLLVPDSITDTALATARATFDPIAASLAPAFHDATMGRGTLNVVTSTVDPTDAGAGNDAAVDEAGSLDDVAPADAAGPMTAHGGCGCRTTQPRSGARDASGAVVALAALLGVRRRRAR